MTEPAEDIIGDVPSFAIADEESKATDPDRQNKSILVDIQKYLKEAIFEHNTIDQIDLTEQAKMTAGQQIAVHKVIVGHLRTIKATIDNKVKEL